MPDMDKPSQEQAPENAEKKPEAKKEVTPDASGDSAEANKAKLAELQEYVTTIQGDLKKARADDDSAAIQELTAELAGVQEQITSEEENLSKMNTELALLEKGAPDAVTSQETPAAVAKPEMSPEETKLQEQMAKYVEGVDNLIKEMDDLEAEDRAGKMDWYINEIDKRISGAKGSRASEVKKKIFEVIGDRILDQASQSVKAVQKKNPTLPAYNTYPVRSLAKMLPDMGRSASPEQFGKHAAFVLDQVTAKFKGKSADEIRDGLFSADSNSALYTTLSPIFKKMARGESLSNDLKASLKNVLPILEASDSSQSKVGQEGASRFLTDEFVARYDDPSEPGLGGKGLVDDKGRLDKKKYGDTVRAALKESSN